MKQAIKESYDLESIVSDSIRIHFQPIVNLKDGNLLGYECLSRGPEGTTLEDPEVLFHEALKRNLSFELERECQKRLLLELRDIPAGTSIFVNIEPHLLQSGEFVNLPLFLAIDRIDPGRVVIELTERHTALDGVELKKNVNFIRSLGYKIALGDIQKTFADLNCIAKLLPDFMKINNKMTSRLSHEKSSQEFLKLLKKTATKTFSLIIAEGIESFDEAKVLNEIGIGFGQGYFFGIPKPHMIYENKIMSSCELEAGDLEIEIGDTTRDFWQVA